MALTAEQLETFRRDGYIVVPDVFAPATMDAALLAVDRITYGKPYQQWVAEGGANAQPVADGISAKPSQGRAQYPTGMDVLDRLIENDAYLDIFEQLLGTTALHYCNAHLFVRAGPNDRRHADNPWEGYHIDHDTNTFLPPFIGTGFFDYINSGVYLHDVEEDCAAMQVIPGSHLLVAHQLARFVREGKADGRGAFLDIRKVPEFSKAKSATGRRGSAIFYSSYLVHAAVPFKDKRKQRSFWTMSIARAETQAWTRFSVPYKYGDREFFIPLWKNTTPRVRSLFGWPPPGHPYYRPQTLELLASNFPGIDLAPYRR